MNMVNSRGFDLWGIYMIKQGVVLSVVLWIGLSASADVNVFSDSFDRSVAQQNDIDAASTGMSGIVAPVTYVERGDLVLVPNDGLTNIENNQLHLADGPNMSVLYLDANLAAGAYASEILNAGGMRIGLTIVSNDGSASDAGRWIGFGVGNTLAECQTIGLDHSAVGFRGQDYYGVQAGTSDLFVSWSPYNGGVINVYKNGPAAAGGENYDIPVGSLSVVGDDRLELELLIDDVNAGTTVYANILWNSVVVGTTTFQWDNTAQNYIGISSRQNDQGFTVDDLTITACCPSMSPVLKSFTATPDSVNKHDANVPVTLQWDADHISIGTTYSLVADKAVVFPNSDNTGTAVNGSASVVADINGNLGSVQFTLTLYRDGSVVLSDTVQVEVLAIPPANAPNVIVILLDDTGWSDLGCYGGEVQTPNIDSLAAGGVRFRNFYQAARCSPSRLAILSGLYTQQAATAPGQSLPPMRTDNNVTIAELLGNEGYRTYISGKWHLGKKTNNRDPISRGFMHAFGLGVYADGDNPAGSYGFWQEGDYHLVSTNNEISPLQYGSRGIQFHATDAVGDYSVAFIEHHLSKGDGRPFFLYMPFNAAHWPINAPAEIANRYTDVGDPAPEDTDICLYESGWDVIRQQKYQRQLAMGVIDSRFLLSPKGDHPVPATPIPAWNTLNTNRQLDLARRQAVYSAMLDQVDRNIGKVINKLNREGLLNNTMIFLCCDNGANYEGGLFGNTSDPAGLVWNPEHLDSMGQPANTENALYPRVNQGGGWANVSNTPFRLFKHFTHEGGIRTSAILYYPAATASSVQGTWTEQRGHVIDVMATVVEAAHATYPTEYKGHTVLPMEGSSQLPILQGQSMAPRDIGIEHETNRAFYRGDYKLATKNFAFSDGSSPAHELELYNLLQDPTELNNLADTEPVRLAQMVEGWNAWALRVGVPSDRLLTVPPVNMDLPEPNYADAFFQDLYNRPDNYDIDAETGGMSGSLMPMVYIESFEGSGAGSIRIQDKYLQMATGVGMGSMYLDHNFNDTAILNQGGFTVMLDILEISGGDAPQDRFGGFGIGLSRAQAAAAGDIGGATTLRPKADGTGVNGVCDFYIDLAMDGVLRAWSGNQLLCANPVSLSHGRIRVDFLCSGFLATQKVIARIYFNGEQQNIVSFTWNEANQNYIGLSARASNYVRMDNLVIMPFESSLAYSADLTGEGDIDLDDLSILAASWLNGYTVPCPLPDFSGDCYVNLKDLGILALQWLSQIE
jgi:arylsulfatase